MKKFLAIAASAVLAVSALAFTACSNNDDGEAKLPSAPEGNYSEVDTSDAEKREELVEEATAKFDLTKMFGDTGADGWSFGLAADFTAKIEASGKMLGVPTDPADATKTEDIDFGANVTLSNSSKVKATAEKAASPLTVVGSSEVKAKGNVNIPEMFYATMGKDAEEYKKILEGFDYTAYEYVDNDYLYCNVPTDIVELLPETLGIPESGKYKTSNDGMLSNLVMPDLGTKNIDISTYVDLVLGMMNTYEVKVSISVDNGYTVKLNAGLEQVYKIVADRTNMPEAAVEGLVAGYVKDISTCELEAYLSVDENGLFRSLGVSLNVAASTELAAGKINPFVPAINANAKIQLGFGISKFDGNVQLPSDLDSYVVYTGGKSDNDITSKAQ